MESSYSCARQAMPNDHHRTVIFLAFGTRGDVQPLACLAEELRRQRTGLQAVLVTHSQHAQWLAAQPFDALGTSFIDSSPYAMHTAASSTASQQGTAPETDVTNCDDHQQHVACWKAVNQLQPGVALLVFNLFALEGYHIAEALQVPCAAAAPYQVPYPCPAGFDRRFIRAYGRQLYGRLVDAQRTDTVSWAEVKTWMWPLFTERWERLRSETLALSRLLHCRRTHQPLQQLPLATPLLYGYSSLIIPRPGFYPDSIHVTSYWQPRLSWLQGLSLSPAVEEFLGARTAGNTPPARHDAAAQGSAAAKPQAATPDAEAPPTLDPTNSVCIDVSSSGHLGLLPSPLFFMSMLARALAAIDRRAILLSSGWQPLEHAHSALEPPLRRRILLHAQPVPHQLLLPRVSLLVHPGGSGSVAAALLAGVPQLTFPLHFDQVVHAERLAHLMLSPQPLATTLLNGPMGPVDTSTNHQQQLDRDTPGTSAPDGMSKRPRLCQGALGREQVAQSACGLPTDDCEASAKVLAGRLTEALSPQMRHACRGMAQALADEDGLHQAVALLLSLVQTARSSPSD